MTCVFSSTSAIFGMCTISAWFMEEKDVLREEFNHIVYHWWTLRRGKGQDRFGRVLVGSVEEVFAIFHVSVEPELRRTKDSWVGPERCSTPWVFLSSHASLFSPCPLTFYPLPLLFSLTLPHPPSRPSLSFLTHPCPRISYPLSSECFCNSYSYLLVGVRIRASLLMCSILFSAGKGRQRKHFKKLKLHAGKQKDRKEEAGGIIFWHELHAKPRTKIRGKVSPSLSPCFLLAWSLVHMHRRRNRAKERWMQFTFLCNIVYMRFL